MSEFAAELIATARALATPGKGILASDESVGTIGRHFSKLGIENNEENRRKYRQLLYTAKGVGEFISGAITFEETLFHNADDGTPFVELMRREGIIPGIKVDKGVVPLYGTDGETVTQGLDDLATRCKKYYAQGARFAKWRAVINISEGGAPSELGIEENARSLARYAAICQANGLVPIVEPEVLMDGTHTLERAAVATERAQAAVLKALSDHHVMLEGILLKPNMVRPGTDGSEPYNLDDIARATVRVLQHTMPPAVPGIMFLSGGMTEEDSTVVLNKMNELDTKKPWTLSFSYGRALQQSVMRAWAGKDENVAEAQRILLVRARANSQATLGRYAGDAASSGAAGESLHVANYSY